MKTPKLRSIGCSVLALCVGLPALAEEAMPEAAAGEMPAEAVAEAPMPEAAPEAPMTEAEVAAEDSVAMESPLPADADDAEGVPEPATGEAEPSAAPSMDLGAVGYDSQGREGRVHVVSPGDTLWDVSDAYLGTPWVWPSIWQDNRDIENPHLIFPGDRIWITPWEMRKVTAEEAEALLSGSPAAPEPEAVAEVVPPPAAPVPAAPAPVTDVVPTEQVSVLIPDRERVGLVSAETVDASASLLANTSPRLMISEHDQVWLGIAEGDTRVGDQYTIYRVQEKVYDPESGRQLGYHVAFLGWTEVLETHDESSLAVIKKSNSEIQVGDLLMPRKQPANEVPLRAAPDGVEGQISFLPNSRTHMGTYDFVYLNRGTLDGVEIGTPLTVYRKGFRTRDEALDTRVQVPDRPVADLLVVRSEDEASVAVIRKTHEELELGDYFRAASN